MYHLSKEQSYLWDLLGINVEHQIIQPHNYPALEDAQLMSPNSIGPAVVPKQTVKDWQNIPVNMWGVGSGLLILWRDCKYHYKMMWLDKKFSTK